MKIKTFNTQANANRYTLFDKVVRHFKQAMVFGVTLFLPAIETFAREGNLFLLPPLASHHNLQLRHVATPRCQPWHGISEPMHNTPSSRENIAINSLDTTTILLIFWVWCWLKRRKRWGVRILIGW